MGNRQNRGQPAEPGRLLVSERDPLHLLVYEALRTWRSAIDKHLPDCGRQWFTVRGMQGKHRVKRVRHATAPENGVDVKHGVGILVRIPHRHISSRVPPISGIRGAGAKPVVDIYLDKLGQRLISDIGVREFVVKDGIVRQLAVRPIRR